MKSIAIVALIAGSNAIRIRDDPICTSGPDDAMLITTRMRKNHLTMLIMMFQVMDQIQKSRLPRKISMKLNMSSVMITLFIPSRFQTHHHPIILSHTSELIKISSVPLSALMLLKSKRITNGTGS